MTPETFSGKNGTEYTVRKTQEASFQALSAYDPNDTLTGSIFYRADHCFIVSLDVSRYARGQGIGKALLVKACLDLKAAGCSEAAGWVRPHRVSYYQQLGAKIDIMGSSEDHVYMRASFRGPLFE